MVIGTEEEAEIDTRGEETIGIVTTDMTGILSHYFRRDRDRDDRRDRYDRDRDNQRDRRRDRDDRRRRRSRS